MSASTRDLAATFLPMPTIGAVRSSGGDNLSVEVARRYAGREAEVGPCTMRTWPGVRKNCPSAVVFDDRLVYRAGEAAQGGSQR